MNDPSASSNAFPLLEVGWYEKLADAREAALGLAAKDIPYSIDRMGREWVIRVDTEHADAARSELAAMEAERQQRKIAPPAPVLEKVRPLPIFIALWVLSGFFFAQQTLPASWTDSGVAISRRIVGEGEWWRCITALTLHGDLPHLIANLGTGLLFAAFLQPLLGTGWTWVLILLSGTLGNLINAWGYRNAAHGSLGASTAVFGALGILVGLEFWAKWSHPDHRNRWTLVVPVGAGLALLAYLGVGDESKRVDITAHLFGLVAGVPLGVLAGMLRLRQRTNERMQVVLAASVFFVVALSWMMATGSR
jgi:rhomboid protease GluP